MKTGKELRNKLKKHKGLGAASRRNVDTQDHRHAEMLDSEPKEPARLSTDASGQTLSPISNNIPTDVNAATLLPHEQMGSSARDSISSRSSWDRAVLAEFTPELCTATKQTDDTLVASRTHSQNADEIEHPFKVYYQRARSGLAGGLIHAWKKWECCHCGSVTHYENHFCSRLPCCHKRCEAQCTTLEASG
ncbi:uncharacterized protein J3D65DRAFT_151932 [Phyllosticta citribraziliensis]|uniref:Uncharacterized protein n=1 Tax=Phyllosticta citribraziliensis TaxID=989973 RepID=A0ABR1L6I5_9PEZI